MNTEQLIADLARDAHAVRPLGGPWRRTAVWALAGFVYLALLVAIMPVRVDLATRLQDPRFLVEQLAALLMGLTAAAAAFASAIPGNGRTILWMPVIALIIWLSAVLTGVAEDASRFGGEIAFRADWRCVGTILLGATVPAVVMALMIRRGAPLTPRVTAALAALAAVGFGNAGICVFHPHASNLVVLLWHCGTVLLITAVVGVAGAHLLRWPAVTGVPTRR
jgi:hypothetical protein